jgi:hypothetical protein
VAHHKDGALARDGLQLVEGGQDEDRSLSETGLGLAKNIDVEDCSRDAVLLDCGEAKRWLDLVSTQGEAAKKQSCRKVNVRSSVHLPKSSYQKLNIIDTTLSSPVASFVNHGTINHQMVKRGHENRKGSCQESVTCRRHEGTPVTGITNKTDRLVSQQRNCMARGKQNTGGSKSRPWSWL